MTKHTHIHIFTYGLNPLANGREPAKLPMSIAYYIDRFAFQRVHDFDVLFSVHIVGSVFIFI